MFVAVPGTNTLARTTLLMTVRVTGTVSAVALLARNPGGSCSFTPFPRHEVDKFAESGTLSF